MFSATKFVVAGAIVALFGGFLLSGVLTQKGDDSLPVVGASAATAEAEPSLEVTNAPETSINSDLLPGVDLKVEEVSPGVFRVISDGERSLRENVWDVLVNANDEVIVRKNIVSGYELGPCTPEDRSDCGPWPVLRNVRGLMLGKPGTTQLDKTDGDLGTQAERDARYRGDTSVVGRGECKIAPDGACWKHHSARGHNLPAFVTRTDTSGNEEVLMASDIGFTPRSSRGDPEPGAVKIADDGTVWISGDGTTERFASFDGNTWSLIPDVPTASRLDLHDWGFDSTGNLWSAYAWRHDGSSPERTRTLLGRWDGEEWSTFGPIDVVERWFAIDPDGSIWVGLLTRFDGNGFQKIELPASEGNDKAELWALAHSADGTIWAVVVDRSPDGTPECPAKFYEGDFCVGQTDGLYVIQPDIALATQ